MRHRQWVQRSILAMLSVFSAPAALTDAIVDPPTCQNNLGERVSFKSRSSDQGRIAAGMANRTADGTPFVLRMNYQAASPAFQKFIDRHECAHHQTGDVDRPHPPRNSPEHLMNESIADCVAILRLREEWGEDESEYPEVLTGLRTAMTAVGFPEISTDSRVHNIENCYRNYESADAFVDDVLLERGLSAPTRTE
jgi:hypothetical protein